MAHVINFSVCKLRLLTVELKIELTGSLQHLSQTSILLSVAFAMLEDIIYDYLHTIDIHKSH